MFVPPADTYGRGGSYEEHVWFPHEQGFVERRVLQPAGRWSTRQSDRQPVDAVKVSAVMINMIPELVDSPVPTGLAGANSSTNDFCDSVVGGPTSTFLKNTGLIVCFAGDVTVGVSFPPTLLESGDVTVGVSSPADLGGDVAVGVSTPADLAGGVTIGVVPSAVAEVASSADIAEVASSADIAEVASSTNLAGDVTVGVTSSAFAEVASLADIAEYFDYDDSYPSVYGFGGPDNYELYSDLHGPHDCGGVLYTSG